MSLWAQAVCFFTQPGPITVIAVKVDQQPVLVRQGASKPSAFQIILAPGEVMNRTNALPASCSIGVTAEPERTLISAALAAAPRRAGIEQAT